MAPVTTEQIEADRRMVVDVEYWSPEFKARLNGYFDALASVRDAEHLAPEPDPKAHRRCKCEFSGGGFPSKVCAYHKRTAHPSADELLREAFSACEPYVGRGDDCGRLARLVSHAINATLARSAT